MKEFTRTNNRSSPSRIEPYRRWHQRIEHYTPNGALGRLFLALMTGSIGLPLLTVGIIGLFNFGLFGMLVAFLVAGIGFVASLFTALLLWPVYLSLIGNVDSARSYSERFESQPAQKQDEESLELLKQQYVNGTISKVEFETRVENLLNVDAAVHFNHGVTKNQSNSPSESVREVE